MANPAAKQGDQIVATDIHIVMIPTPGGPFQTPPKNRGEVFMGSTTVNINGKPAARMGDPALTCNDPADQPVGQVIAVSTVMIGG